MLPKHILDLQAAVEAANCCRVTYSHAKLVRNRIQESVWEGLVYVFRLYGHPKAMRCYAWQYRDGIEIKSVTMLEIPPAVSAESAVAEAMLQCVRARRVV